MPKKLTLAQVAKMAREKDPDAWKSMTPEAQRDMVDKLNAQAGRQGCPDEKGAAAAAAKFERIVRACAPRKR